MYSNRATLALLCLALGSSAASLDRRNSPQITSCKPNTCPGQAQAYYPPAADCTEYIIPVSIEWENKNFNFTPHWETDYDLTDFLEDATTRAGADYPGVFSAATTASGTYKIAASFCTPKHKTGKEKTVVMATHGIGPSRDHWNSPFQPEQYNFVQFAINQGYSVFFYDRLGLGHSDRVDGYSIQLNTAVAVIQELAGIVRSGHVTGSVGVPNKLALMGFSFASFATHTAIAATPHIADAVILTGIGLNSTGLNGNGLLRSFVPRVANLQSPRFSTYNSGYLTWVDEFAQIDNYFKKPYYDPAAAIFTEEVKIPFSIAEFLTFGDGAAVDAGNYTGPVLAITGETDYIVCDGYCPGIYDEPISTYYRNAKLTKHIHPGSSHNFNFHHNATGAYQVITDFLKSSGL